MGAEVARDLPCDIQGGCGGRTTMKQYTDGKHCYKCNRSVAFDTNHEEYVDTMDTTGNAELTEQDKEKIKEQKRNSWKPHAMLGLKRNPSKARHTPTIPHPSR